MPKPSEDRKGGLSNFDPAVRNKWVEGAAENQAAVPEQTKRSRRREANRVRLDVPSETKRYLAAIAAERKTSSSQLGAFLLTWALVVLEEGWSGVDETSIHLRTFIDENTGPSRGIKVENDIDIPHELLETLRTALGIPLE